MTVDKIAAMREELESIKSDIYDITSRLYDWCDELKDRVMKIEEQNNKLSQEEFAIWIQHGITQGAVFYIEGLSEDNYTVTGISCNVFVAKDKNGKEYILTSRMLKSIDKFKVVGR